MLGRTGSEGVREGFREQSWKVCSQSVCGLRFDNSERIIADLGPTFRDLSIGTLLPLHYVHYLTV